MTVGEVVESINNIPGFHFRSETEDMAKFMVILSMYPVAAILDKKEVAEIVANLNAFNSNEDIEIYNSNSYEVLIKNENILSFRNRRKVMQEDTINDLKYTLDEPSPEYFLFLLYKLNKNKALKTLISRSIAAGMLKATTLKKEKTEPSVLDIIKKITPRLRTIKISSDSPRRLDEFEKLLHAFIFNLGYNLDLNIQPLRFIEEFIQPYKMGRIRRSGISEVEPPKRVYLNDLVLHYQKAVSSDILDHQYLSFYHVIEYFLEKIYNDDVINTIKQELTKPDFSYKRTRDIKSLIGIIQRKLRYRNQEFIINELEAVELTLRKYITNIESFKESLLAISRDLVDYYRENEVGFSNGPKVNFESSNTDEIFKNLSKRIYQTRNSIVHSKENEKNKYVPFKNDKDLLSELYLMRLIAETLILESSKEL